MPYSLGDGKPDPNSGNYIYITPMPQPERQQLDIPSTARIYTVTGINIVVNTLTYLALFYLALGVMSKPKQ